MTPGSNPAHEATHELQPLADDLGVSVASLTRLGVTRKGNTWHYPERDAAGEVVGTNRRYDDGSKRMVRGGRRGLCYALAEHGPGPLSSTAGVSADDPLVVVEGMSDGAAGLDLRYDVVGRSTATPGPDELAWLVELVAGRHVAIVAEHDGGVGMTGAAATAAAMHGRAASVKVVEPPAGVKDLRTWVVEHGCDRAELAAAIRGAEVWTPAAVPVADDAPPLRRRPVTRCLADVQAERLRWLWPGRLALGKLAIIAGNGGLGKSTVTMDIAARVTTGGGWPDSTGERFDPGGVVLLSAEDDAADTIRPRLDAAGADCSRMMMLDAVMVAGDDGGEVEAHFDLAADLLALEQVIVDTPDCRLVVIDPLTAYLGKADDHKNAEVRGLLAPLARLAAKHGVAVLGVTHLNKGQGEAIHRIVGSIAYGAAARTALAVTKDPDEPARRLMVGVKSNIAAEHAGLGFSVVPCIANPDVGVVRWDDRPVEVSADDAMSRTAGDDDGRTALDEAAEWLGAYLAEGPRLAGEGKKQAAADGIASRTLDRARAKLGVICGPDGFHGPWCWRLPEAEASDDASTPDEPPAEADPPQCSPTSAHSAIPHGMANTGDDGELWTDDKADAGAFGR